VGVLVSLLRRLRELRVKSNNTYWRRVRARLIEERGGRCERCGSTWALEFAHVKPTGLSGRGRGYTQRVIDVRDHPDAYKLLCSVCHALSETDF
jgi:5-methylcytosine-specific restriction endonuclease McrA